MGEYPQPDVLVDIAWVEDHLDDPKVRIIEVDDGEIRSWDGDAQS